LSVRHQFHRRLPRNPYCARLIVIGLLSASVAACGGGSSSGNSVVPSAGGAPAPASAPAPPSDVTITLNPACTRAISPYIYGLNFYNSIANAPPLLTFDRAGGNRWTAYNWENNASNAGSEAESISSVSEQHVKRHLI